MLSVVSASAQLSFGQPEKINEGWKFVLRDQAEAKLQDFDDKAWQTVDLPHDWSVKQPYSPTYASCTGFLPGGIGWYRKSLNIPQEKRDERVYLYFEGVYNRSEVFVNGQSVGSRPNGYISFSFDITPFVRFGENNIIAVRVDHSQNADSRWYTGSGIYRDVWLVYANPVHIAQWGVFVEPQGSTSLQVNIEIQNQSDNNANIHIINELIDASGKVAAKKSQKIQVTAQSVATAQTQLSVKDAKMWDLDNPNLYILKTSVLQNGKVIDETETQTAFRIFTFDPDEGFFLNGKNMKIKGVCLHHDAGVLGSAVPRDVWKRRLRTLKGLGVNAIRTSHNAQAPDLYELCDEIGLLVMNEAYDEWEFPKNKWIEGWNQGTPGHQGSFDIFAQWGEQDLADMVRRDRNHPSIFAWSIGNEVDYPNDPYSHPILDGDNKEFTQKIFGGYKKDAPDAMRLGGIAKRLAAVVKKYNPSRPVTAGLAGVVMSNQTEYPDALDIAGYNYTESLYQSDHQKYPRRIIYGSENRHDIAAWKAVKDNKHISGQFLWTGIDYLGESGRWPSRGSTAGLLDLGGFIKPRGYFRQSLWSDEPMIYIGTYPANQRQRWLSTDAHPIWNYTDNQQIKVVCYTNSAKAKLLLNGKQIDETKDYDEQTGIIYWDIPYQAGKLEAIGLNADNKEVTRYTIQTTKRPHSLKIISSEKVISKDGGLAQIAVQVVDEDGLPVLLADNEITCVIEGEAKLLGLEASNNTDVGDYTDNRQRAFLGRLIAYIQATGKAGTIKVDFTANWLKGASVEIETVN